LNYHHEIKKQVCNLLCVFTVLTITEVKVVFKSLALYRFKGPCI